MKVFFNLIFYEAAIGHPKVLRASRDNCKMMLEAMLEALVEKIKQKYVFLD